MLNAAGHQKNSAVSKIWTQVQILQSWNVTMVALKTPCSQGANWTDVSFREISQDCLQLRIRRSHGYEKASKQFELHLEDCIDPRPPPTTLILHPSTFTDPRPSNSFPRLHSSALHRHRPTQHPRTKGSNIANDATWLGAPVLRLDG